MCRYRRSDEQEQADQYLVQAQALAGDAKKNRRGGQQAPDAEGGRLGRTVQARVEIFEAYQTQRADKGKRRAGEDEQGQQDFGGWAHGRLTR